MKKLVRDKIPEIMKKNNKEFKLKVLENDNEYFLALNKKLVEEVNEYLEASLQDNSENIKYEIADILEVIDSICKVKGYGVEEIGAYKLRKRMERGGFSKRFLSEF